MGQEHQYFLLATLVGYFVKFVSTVLASVLGYGRSMNIKKIEKEREKHVWAVQVLNELLQHATMYNGNVCLRASQLQIKSEGNVYEGNSSDDDSREENSGDETILKDPRL
ncbi:hypothetical protein PanWU01x14_036100 [Parasponia andersonii]|uniref:Uncharacterized protein n=1 Tax=Parasponia andersonii TaxID=3476 RepID=A0A2P5DSE0_PARAD|nr:hypothetical protein PanWU01x14_036100 [Parasponia andersonii]